MGLGLTGSLPLHLHFYIVSCINKWRVGLCVQTHTLMMVNQLPNVLVLLVFVINLRSCLSLCDITGYRQLYAAPRPKCEKLDACRLRDGVVRRATEKAGVVLEKVIEAYRVRTSGTTLKMLKLFMAPYPVYFRP